ncbi:hypothetical protein PCH_Pc18g04930 [Penicillium rubens Wisconsin 54-1255]|uniref:Uncharacterized protein n=1 Tax=Penicillium rubens (strain ATCC 28089 / DSM 1075 / NRRL 1951 / Wisconsin 54-1255) TaxID=500485 RepID=B6HBW5_PENRW|nr:hypothetical protein PCH_Pc18g04930 [Penicillium rubens Wisconsin 54-1255]
MSVFDLLGFVGAFSWHFSRQGVGPYFVQPGSASLTAPLPNSAMKLPRLEGDASNSTRSKEIDEWEEQTLYEQASPVSGVRCCNLELLYKRHTKEQLGHKCIPRTLEGLLPTFTGSGPDVSRRAGFRPAYLIQALQKSGTESTSMSKYARSGIAWRSSGMRCRSTP